MKAALLRWQEMAQIIGPTDCERSRRAYKTRQEAVSYGTSCLTYLVGVRGFEPPTTTTPL